MEKIRDAVRRVMGRLAKVLDKASHGKITPNGITLFGLLAHVPIAWLIAMQHYRWAALLMIVFGLFDTLDGALARVQGKTSNLGMFLDSTTDRMKEILIYVGIAFAFVATDQPYLAIWAVAGIGVSLLVSYINAWGEVTLANHKSSEHKTNKSLRTGLMTFDVRMACLVIGLLVDRLAAAVIIVAILTFITALQRISNVVDKFHV